MINGLKYDKTHDFLVSTEVKVNNKALFHTLIKSR